MKTSIAVSLWLAVSATASPLERRQQPGFLTTFINYLPASMKAAPTNVEVVKPKIRAGAIRKVARYGPFTIPANLAGAKAPTGGHGGHGGDAAPAGGMGGMGGMSMAAPAAPSAWDALKDAWNIISATKPMDPGGFSTMKILQPGAMCTDCTVLGGKMSVVFENGSRADVGSGVYLHHAISVDLSKSNEGFVGLCPPNVTVFGKSLKLPINIFIGGAVDDFDQLYTTPDGKFNSGYYIKDNTFMMQAEMINYLPSEQKVFVQTDIEYVPGKVGPNAEQMVLSVKGCDGDLQPWKPPKNTKGVVGTDGFEVYRDGHIVLARGHMHDGGSSVNLYVNGKLYCESVATYGGKGGTIQVEGKPWETIATMTECNSPIPVKKGDLLRVEAAYDTQKHPLRESKGIEQENMGIMTMIFAGLD